LRRDHAATITAGIGEQRAYPWPPTLVVLMDRDECAQERTP